MATTSDLRTNIIIRYNGQLHRVVEFHHHAPGNWRAMVIMKLKNVQTGKVIEDRVRAGADIEIVRVEKRSMQFLYRDGDTFHFMDTETFEQLSLSPDEVGDARDYLKENTEVDMLLIDGSPATVELPNFLELQITKTDPGIRGDTASGGSKPATLETGAVVQVPLFLNEGDVIKVDTRSGEYLGRVAAAR
jgi:elongation factor P